MQSFDINETVIKFRYPILILLTGLILMISGLVIFKSGALSPKTKIEVLSGTTEAQETGEITAEISGGVLRPGVYKLASGSRIEDLLIAAGGFSELADRVWTDKYLNRAAKLSDGQKIFIPSKGKQTDVLSAKSVSGDQTVSPVISSDSKPLININSSSLGELDSLPGIGQIYGQNIIEHRPYSNTEELVSKGVLKKNVYEKIKEMITIY